MLEIEYETPEVSEKCPLWLDFDDTYKGDERMGKGGRFGKYGEYKRFERLRQKRKLTLKVTKNLRERKAPKR